MFLSCFSDFFSILVCFISSKLSVFAPLETTQNFHTKILLITIIVTMFTVITIVTLIMKIMMLAKIAQWNNDNDDNNDKITVLVIIMILLKTTTYSHNKIMMAAVMIIAMTINREIVILAISL